MAVKRPAGEAPGSLVVGLRWAGNPVAALGTQEGRAVPAGNLREEPGSRVVVLRWAACNLAGELHSQVAQHRGAG